MAVMKLSALRWGSGPQQLKELLQALKAVQEAIFRFESI